MTPLPSRTDSSTNVKQRRKSDLTKIWRSARDRSTTNTGVWNKAIRWVGCRSWLARGGEWKFTDVAASLAFLYISVGGRCVRKGEVPVDSSIIRDEKVCKKYFVAVHGLLDTEDVNTTLLRNVCDSLPVGTLWHPETCIFKPVGVPECADELDGQFYERACLIEKVTEIKSSKRQWKWKWIKWRGVGVESQGYTSSRATCVWSSSH